MDKSRGHGTLTSMIVRNIIMSCSEHWDASDARTAPPKSFQVQLFLQKSIHKSFIVTLACFELKQSYTWSQSLKFLSLPPLLFDRVKSKLKSAKTLRRHTIDTGNRPKHWKHNYMIESSKSTLLDLPMLSVKHFESVWPKFHLNKRSLTFQRKHGNWSRGCRKQGIM